MNPISGISAVTPNIIKKNATINIDDAPLSPNQKQRYRNLKKVPRVYTLEEKRDHGYREIHQFYAR